MPQRTKLFLHRSAGRAGSPFERPQAHNPRTRFLPLVIHTVLRSLGEKHYLGSQLEPCRTGSSACDTRCRSFGTCFACPYLSSSRPLLRQPGVTAKHVASAQLAGFPTRVARQPLGGRVDFVHTGTRRAIQAMAVTSSRRRDRLHWLQPQASSQRLVIVDHGRFIAAIEHMGLRP